MSKLQAVQRPDCRGRQAWARGSADADHGSDDASKGQEPPLVIDGPFAETKEQLLGFYVVECQALEEALEIARELAASQSRRSLRDTTDRDFPSRSRRRVTDLACINTALISARPRAVAALLRYFRNLETAEEAFQEACLRALKTLAPERSTARPCSLADHGRAKRSPRCGTPSEQAVRIARRGGRVGLGRRRGCPRRAAGRCRTIATTSCGCCSSAAIPISR